MRPTEQVLLTLVRQWISKADVDYLTADRLLRDAEPVREAVAFHCQQAAEKYLKAFLVSQGIQFPRTHSIGQLLDLVSPVAPEIALALESVAVLTPFGVELRYPGDFPEVLPGEETTAFDLARQTRETIMVRLDSFLSESSPDAS